MLATMLDNRSIGILLRVMDMQEARAQGAVLRLMGQRAADGLIDSGLLVEDGVIPIVVMMDDYEDEPVAAEWSPEHRAYGYWENSGRWVRADHCDIAAYKVDFPRAVAGMLVQFDRAGSPPPQTLLEGHLLDLGVIRLPGAEKPVPVWFGRCLGTPWVWQKVASFMERRPAVGPRIILTSTQGERIPPSPNKRDVIVAVSDVLAGYGSLAISSEILNARVFPGQVQRHHPIDHSDDYGIVWLNGRQIPFKGDKKREALRQLFTAYWNNSPRLRTAAVLEEAGYGTKVNSLPKAFGDTGNWRLFIKYADGYCWIEIGSDLQYSSGRPSPGGGLLVYRPGFLRHLPVYLPAIFPGSPSGFAILGSAIVREPPQENQMATRHLSQIELAARWNISHRTLERWRTVGEGPRFIRLIGRVVYRLEDVEAYEAEQLGGGDAVQRHAATA